MEGAAFLFHNLLRPRHTQGYLSVLHLKAVVYVSLDNSVLGELGYRYLLALSGGSEQRNLSLSPAFLPSLLFRRWQVPC